MSNTPDRLSVDMESAELGESVQDAIRVLEASHATGQYISGRFEYIAASLGTLHNSGLASLDRLRVGICADCDPVHPDTGEVHPGLISALQMPMRYTYWMDRHWDHETQRLPKHLHRSFRWLVEGAELAGSITWDKVAGFLVAVLHLYDPFTYVCVEMLEELHGDVTKLLHHQGRYFTDLAKRANNDELPIFIPEEPITAGLPPERHVGRMVFDTFQVSMPYLDIIHRTYMRGGNFASCATAATYAHNAYLRALRNLLTADWSLSE